MKKLIAVLVVVVLAGAGGIVAWKRTHAAPVEEESETSVATVTRGPIRQSVHCTGRVVSNRDVEIKCKASGQVVRLPFDVSDPVKKGDLLVEIDPVDQQRGVQTAEAALAVSEAKLAQAKANLGVAEQNVVSEKLRTEAQLKAAEARVADTAAKYKREKELLERKNASIEEAETAHTAAIQAEQDRQSAVAQVEATKALELQLEVRRQDIKLAEAEIQSDSIALALAKQRLSETNVVAPIDGVVATRAVQIGQIIASGVSNVGGGTAALTLSDLSQVFVYGSVDESEIGDVALDQRVEITADAFPRKIFDGKVVRIATKGVNVSNVVTFEVRIEVTSENKSLLKPEMTTNVDIIVGEKSDVLLVPVTAIVRTREGLTVSRKSADGSEEKVPVEAGISDGSQTEIVSGLAEGDEVIVRKTELDSRWRASSTTQRRGGPPMMFGGPRGRR